MVLPYLKGLINKKTFLSIYILLFFGYISIILYFQIRSIKSGIRALSWAKWRYF